MGTYQTQKVERLARILYPEYDTSTKRQQAVYQARTCRALDAGVTLPPEPPTWKSDGRYIRWTDDSHMAFRTVPRDGTAYSEDVGMARRLADHLNATGFTPDGE